MNAVLLSVAFVIVVFGVVLSAFGFGRLVGNLFLLCLMAFSGFGFVACFEPHQSSIPWMLVYILSGLMSSASFFHVNFRFDQFES